MPERQPQDNHIEGMKLPGFVPVSSALTRSATFFGPDRQPIRARIRLGLQNSPMREF
jgi:hypothetical protein